MKKLSRLISKWGWGSVVAAAVALQTSRAEVFNVVDTFVENFEFSNSLDSWNLFEELVTSCYREDVGAIELNSSAAYEGNQGMVVWSNKNLTKGISNHIIAGNKVFEGVDGQWRYTLHSQIPLESFETTQVGPEFSVQNTRDEGSGVTTTDIGGIQYVSTKYVSDKWKIWIESSPSVAVWSNLDPARWATGEEPILSADVWYKFTLDLDYDHNVYLNLTVEDVGGTDSFSADLSGLKIAKEPREFGLATVLTVEGENLYGNCGEHGPFESKLYYDKLLFEPMPSVEDNFMYKWGYEFTTTHPDYTDEEVLSWNFNVYAGNFGSSSNSYFMKDHAVPVNGQLVLTIDQANNTASPSRPYTSGGVNTAAWANHGQIYGRWEVEAQFPAGFGVTGYIGLFRKDKVWPPEVDFAEVIGRESTNLYMTQHHGTSEAHLQKGDVLNATTLGIIDWNSKFHVFAIEWTPNDLKYFVDGALVLNQTVDFDPFMMDVAIGTGTGDCGSWVDCPENAAANGFDFPLPAKMLVNWVKVYEYVDPTDITPSMSPTTNCFKIRTTY